jgi:hypothetical protein
VLFLLHSLLRLLLRVVEVVADVRTKVGDTTPAVMVDTMLADMVVRIRAVTTSIAAPATATEPTSKPTASWHFRAGRLLYEAFSC